MKASTLLTMVDQLPNNHLLMASRWSSDKESWDTLQLPHSLNGMKRLIQMKGKKGSHFWVLKWTADHDAFSDPKLLDDLFFSIAFMIGSTKPMIGTALSELTNNAIDHGLLHMPSQLKRDHEGMVTYFEERIKRLEQAKQQKLHFSFYFFTEGMTQRLAISCEDTGDGFSIEDLPKSQESIKDGETAKYYGRGINLLQAISSDLYNDKDGRRSTIIMDLS